MRHFLFFDRFLFPGIATFIYWLGLVVILATTLYSVVLALASGGVSTMGTPAAALGMRGFVSGPVGALIFLVSGIVAALVWRLVSEFWMVIFSIRDILREIRDQGRSR